MNLPMTMVAGTEALPTSQPQARDGDVRGVDLSNSSLWFFLLLVRDIGVTRSH